MRFIHIRYKIEVRCEISLRIVNSAGVTVGVGTDSQYYRDYRVVLSVKVEPGNSTEIMQPPPTSLPLNRIFSTVTCMTRSALETHDTIHCTSDWRDVRSNIAPLYLTDQILAYVDLVVASLYVTYCTYTTHHPYA